LDDLLRAIAKLGGTVEAHRFVIVGDGPEESRLKQLASSLGLQNKVTFTGALELPAICRLYEQSEFFVLPSRSEPFGIVLLEAMTFSKALVATRVGGITEFVVDGYNGLLVDPDDSDALADQIKRLLVDHTLRERIGMNGRRCVSQSHDYSVVMKKYEMLLQQLYEAPSRERSESMAEANEEKP
jgi:glycosyltransferase involved in cell wall biosynthesis